jgi:hypothetical protein
MILEKRPSRWLWVMSWLVFRIPGRPAAKMAEFSHTEAGSALDMIAATELTSRPDLRAKFFRHALDEHKHARLFAQRAIALSREDDRVRALVEDSTFILSRGIRSKEPLHAQLSDAEFFAFIWIHELAGARQFDVYSSLMERDEASASMFGEIGRDERFHIAYSRGELDRMIADGRGAEVRKAIFLTRFRRARNAFLRGSRRFGDVMSGVWLTIAYFVVLGPFALIARLTERNAQGFMVPPAVPAERYAASQA